MRKWKFFAAAVALSAASLGTALAAGAEGQPQKQTMDQAIAYEKHKAKVSETDKPDPFDAIAKADGRDTETKAATKAETARARRQAAREVAASKRQK